MLSVEASAGDTNEDSEDSSSSSSSSIHSSNVLEQFRQKWQEELQVDSGKLRTEKDENVNEKINQNFGDVNATQLTDAEEQAKSLFQEGTELERLGKVFEAMRLYRRAIQIVPDIEFRMYEQSKSQLKQEQSTNANTGLIDDSSNATFTKEEHEEEDENLDDVDLMERFQISIQKVGRLFQRAINDLNVISTGGDLHISDLPLEIILYILRWVVSSDLDMRSLDQCSMVSKGFYICAKDPDIWRLACFKIWGVNVGSINCLPYTNWRQMFLERHRVHFNGCYISKTNYLRYGENSFQDQFYRPVQLIEYYRYLRFFPDGHILMMTSTDEPAQGVVKLKAKYPSKSEILKGHYRLHGDMVIIVLKRNRTSQPYQRQRRNAGPLIEDIENHTYFVELKILSSSKRRFNQLQWKHYSIIQKQSKSKDEISTDFELTQSKYPSLYFSRVKSYHLVSEYPLQ